MVFGSSLQVSQVKDAVADRVLGLIQTGTTSLSSDDSPYLSQVITAKNLETLKKRLKGTPGEQCSALKQLTAQSFSLSPALIHRLYPLVVKLLPITYPITLCKLVHQFLVKFSPSEEDLALLCVSQLQKLLEQSPSAHIRSLALSTLLHLWLPDAQAVIAMELTRVCRVEQTVLTQRTALLLLSSRCENIGEFLTKRFDPPLLGAVAVALSNIIRSNPFDPPPFSLIELIQWFRSVCPLLPKFISSDAIEVLWIFNWFLQISSNELSDLTSDRSSSTTGSDEEEMSGEWICDDLKESISSTLMTAVTKELESIDPFVSLAAVRCILFAPPSVANGWRLSALNRLSSLIRTSSQENQILPLFYLAQSLRKFPETPEWFKGESTLLFPLETQSPVLSQLKHVILALLSQGNPSWGMKWIQQLPMNSTNDTATAVYAAVRCIASTSVSLAECVLMQWILPQICPKREQQQPSVNTEELFALVQQMLRIVSASVRLSFLQKVFRRFLSSGRFDSSVFLTGFLYCSIEWMNTTVVQHWAPDILRIALIHRSELESTLLRSLVQSLQFCTKEIESTLSTGELERWQLLLRVSVGFSQHVNSTVGQHSEIFCHFVSSPQSLTPVENSLRLELQRTVSEAQLEFLSTFPNGFLCENDKMRQWFKEEKINQWKLTEEMQKMEENLLAPETKSNRIPTDENDLTSSEDSSLERIQQRNNELNQRNRFEGIQLE